MAVSIEKRPIGVVLGTCVSANINQDYSSVFATVNRTAHGLSDGDYVYVQSNVENYNGFWRVEVTNANEFLLIDNPYVEWIVDAEITYCPQVSIHGWSCVHLPIVYELSNTLFPTNSVNAVRTITSITNDNGLVNVNLSGNLGATGTFEDLSFIKISNAPDSDFDGVHQILDKLAANDVTLNLDYASTPASGIVGASIQLYYSSYNIVVKVYAGLNSSHEWADQKPYALISTLELIPDSNNRVKFSINDILKSYVKTKNNLALPSLPNNIDAFTQFYIEVGEQYDTSNGYTVSTFQGAFASDQTTFEGIAVNSMLAFKNVHSGYLSEYIMLNSSSKFLTLFAIPVLFSCQDTDCYTDISFINPTPNNPIGIKKEFYVSGQLATTTTTDLGVLDEGVIRAELEAECAYDRVDITVVSLDEVDPLSEFLNYDDGTGDDPWTLSATPSITLGGTDESQYLYDDFISVDGTQYTIAYTANFGLNGANMSIYFLDEDFNELNVVTVPEFNTGVQSGSVQITPSGNGKYIAVQLLNGGLANTFTMQDLSKSLPASANLSETKTYEIDCGCSNQEIRLTWLNNLGGFDYWAFTGETDHTIDIRNSGETKQNIFPEWPKSYGETADTIRKQTFRESAKREYIFSQHLTQDQADAIAYLKSSPLVQIITSRNDRRSVIVDTDSFSKYSDGDKTFTIAFNILYTDDIPSQTV